MTRALLLLAFSGLSACSMAMGRPIVPVCASDEECAGGQVCFVDGCGDPARGVVIEVAGSALAGQYAQDFPLADGGLSGRLDLSMRSPLVVQGEFQRELSSTVDPTNRTLYSDAVVVRATGVSEYLPGVSRTYEARFDKTERGVFSMALGSGIFSVTAVPADPSIPPEEQDELLVRAQEQAPAVKFAFPSIDGTVILSGRLVKERVSIVPPVEVALTDVAMDLQAFDPTTRMPLSQRVPVSSGTAGSRGDFVIALAPRVRDMGSFILVASPREASSIVPTRTFSLSTPLPSAVTLELGDYGDPIQQVKGVALDASGAPIAGASVIVEGTVGGGGTFRSRVAITDPQGLFALDLLRNPPDGTLTATIAPPSDSRAGLTRVSVKVGPLVGDTVSLSPASCAAAIGSPSPAPCARPAGRPRRGCASRPRSCSRPPSASWPWRIPKRCPTPTGSSP